MVKILLAEDDKDLNALICARLTQEGYEAIPCADGQEAWETLENCAADLVITDIMMPRMDGFALAGRIRETDKKLPILFLTALDDKPSKQRGFALGIEDAFSAQYRRHQLRHGGPLLGQEQALRRCLGRTPRQAGIVRPRQGGCPAGPDCQVPGRSSDSDAGRCVVPEEPNTRARTRKVRWIEMISPLPEQLRQG